MNLEGTEHPTYRRRRPGEPRHVFLSEYKEGLLESEEEEFLEEEEQPYFVREEMGDKNYLLGGSEHGLFGGSGSDPKKKAPCNDSFMNILNYFFR